MRRRSLFALLAVAALVAGGLLPWSSPAAPAKPAEETPVRKKSGIETRVPWTTSRIVGSPDPAPPYVTAVAFPKLRFNEPLTFAIAPNHDRIFVAERFGGIRSFARDPAAEEIVLAADLKRVLYGMAFHPKFAENGYVFLTIVADTANPSPTGTRVSRFQMRADKPLEIDPDTEQVIIEWPSGGHNGGCLKFGPDGFLYIVTGDGSGIGDELITGQNVNDLLGAMLRIDVDHPTANLPYGIPADNPFRELKGARPEVYAYGLRQLWKFGFDPETGLCWGGEIGQDLWESVHLIRNGSNHGWSVKESVHPFRPERPLGPTPIVAPIVEHPHTDFRSITGGYVYHGERLPELQGAYIYADYDTGRIWMLRYDTESKKVTEHRELADGNLRIVEIGQDPAGEIYFVDHIGGQIHQLVAYTASEERPVFPRKLSETGLFSSAKDLTPAPGLIPYSVNSELWSDHATKERYLAIPGEGKIEFDSIRYPQPAPGAPRGWRFPNGTVAVKTFFMEMEKGNPASRRRLETRILHIEQTPGTQEMGDQVWQGYTYIWNDEQTEAILAQKNGLDKVLSIKDADAPGGVREQTWHFPSRAECIMCHTMPAKFTLGVNTLQLNRDHNYNGVVANQLKTFEHLGLFVEPLAASPSHLPKLAQYRDETASLEDRARSYLHANCAHCHMKWGGGNAEFQLLATLDLDETGTLGVRPQHGAFDLKNPQLVIPGNAEQSMVYHRMTRLGLGRMPHIGSNVIDKEGAELIKQWLDSLGKKETAQRE